tara:strand:+ start:88 stop:573 length:486 start_codon:yes stop_codon:yes gene_type:complete
MDDIKIINNFLTREEMGNIWEDVPGLQWIRQRSNPDDYDIDFLMSEVMDREYYNTYLYDRVVSCLDEKVKLQRVYFNGQYWGCDGSIHTDGCDITALIYINPYSDGFGGFTEMWNGDDHYVIPPIQGRLVFFPGNWDHKAYPFSRQNIMMRMTLAYKLELC